MAHHRSQILFLFLLLVEGFLQFFPENEGVVNCGGEGREGSEEDVAEPGAAQKRA